MSHRVTWGTHNPVAILPCLVWSLWMYSLLKSVLTRLSLFLSFLPSDGAQLVTEKGVEVLTARTRYGARVRA